MSKEKIKNPMKMLHQFHTRFGAPPPYKMNPGVHLPLANISEELRAESSSMLQISRIYTDRGEHEHANRVFRIHLMLEELSEVVQALGSGNEVDLADGLADLLYVTYGTAVSFDIPVNEVFKEVHRSNMTKRAKAGGEEGVGGDRVDGGDCGKGKEYSPPDIEQAIKEGREQQ